MSTDHAGGASNTSVLKQMYRTRVEGDLPERLRLDLRVSQPLRYGENPHQPGAVYRALDSGITEVVNLHEVKSGKGGISATNYMDVVRALNILKYFKRPSAVVMKHLLPSGFATQNVEESLRALYSSAREADAQSAFGGVAVVNRMLDAETANEMLSTYIECVAAPGFEQGVLDILGHKKDLRVLEFANLQELPKFVGDAMYRTHDIRTLPNGEVLVQEPYVTKIKGLEDCMLPCANIQEGEHAGLYKVARRPTEQETRDLLTAWYLVGALRSNGIVFVKEGVTKGIGTGKVERFGAVREAITNAYQKALDAEGIEYDRLGGANLSVANSYSLCPLSGAVLASDGFFPFRDSIDLAARVGVSAVIQPGGSNKDYEVITAVNEHGMSMLFTGERCFAHI